MMDSSDDLLTVAEVANYLGVSPHTIYRWIALGTLPAARYSRKVIRVRRSDLLSFAPANPGMIGEARAVYETTPRPSEAAAAKRSRDFRRLMVKYREIRDRPRSPDEPRPGSREALLRHVGRISHEDAEELRRVIQEAKSYSPPVEFE